MHLHTLLLLCVSDAEKAQKNKDGNCVIPVAYHIEQEQQLHALIAQARKCVVHMIVPSRTYDMISYRIMLTLPHL